MVSSCNAMSTYDRDWDYLLSLQKLMESSSVIKIINCDTIFIRTIHSITNMRIDHNHCTLLKTYLIYWSARCMQSHSCFVHRRDMCWGNLWKSNSPPYCWACHTANVPCREDANCVRVSHKSRYYNQLSCRSDHVHVYYGKIRDSYKLFVETSCYSI